MTDRATKLINMILSHEGGYSSGNEKQTKGDSGKETYCGISRVYNPNWNGWKIIDTYKPIKYNSIIDNNDLKLSVIQFYYKNYYTPLKCGQFDSLLIAGHLICHGVNAGIKTSVKLLQTSINNVYNIGIDVDGIVGADTLAYSNGDKKTMVENEFIKQRNNYYKNIVARKPSQKKFLNGWLNRVKNTTKECSTSYNVLLTTIGKNGLFEKLLSFIFKLLQSLIKKG